MVARVGGTSSRARGIILLLFASLWPSISLAQNEITFTVGSNSPEIPEEQPEGSVIVDMYVFYVVGFAPRTESSGSYRFVNTSAPDVDKFSLDPATGVVSNAVILDRDAPGAQTSFTLDLDFFSPADNFTATTTLQISLLDVNDNPPRFTQEVYETAIAENTTAGAAFITVQADDPDQVQRQQLIDEETEDFLGFQYTISNGLVNYTITGGNELDHFAVNLETGAVSVAPGQSLDVDDVDFYNLTIVAQDGGGLTDTASVIVRVFDSNDNVPVIHSPTSIEITISEDTPPGYVVITSINATDDDFGPNAEIDFLILSGDVANSFTIDSTTGELYISGPLDRELTADGTLTLTIAARDRGIPSLQSTIPVVIHITDINDSPPQFDQASYTLTISETARAGDVVGQVTAVDNDAGENGTVTYSLYNHTSSQFSIDSTTGIITTNITLDRETTPTYNLTVLAVDNPFNESFQLSSTVSVVVAVGDVNDNPPEWSQSLYTAGVLDTASVGFEVIRVLATDRDSGSNAQLRYELFAPPDNDFVINLNNGSVTVNADLDFATKSSYIYRLRVSDSGAVPSDAFADLNITVHTPNIHQPMFEMAAYSETVLETLSIGSAVLNATATDFDPGLIGQIRYRIAAESMFDAAGSFSIDPVTGTIRVASSLDYDFRDNITFMVEAYDGGFPEPFTDLANVTVFLLNANDEPPIITIPSSSPLVVPENQAPPFEIGNLLDFTSDRDPGSGGLFNLSLVGVLGDDPDPENASFIFNSTTGILSAARVFDREDQPDGFTLQVLATDFGSPTQSLINNVTVIISDRNDEAPFFTDNVTATAYEFLPPGQLVFSNFTADDLDIGSNAVLEYAVFSGDTFNSFTIDSTGTLTTIKTLNKTEQRHYNLTILAMDGGIPPLIGFGLVEVEILDANDNPPVFNEPLEAFFSEDLESGQVIYRLNVTDPDEGTNAFITYHFAPNATGNFSYIDEDTNATVLRFAINSTSGEIRTSDTFDREVEETFNVTVIAVDMGVIRLTSTASVFIYVEDINDNPPYFMNDSYTAYVEENAAINTSLLTVTAEDDDATSPHNDIVYSLSGNRSEVLAIDPETGEITVDDEIDWEEGPMFTVELIATNPDGNFSSTAELTVIIMNVNDRAPEWIAQSLNHSVLENQPPESVVGSIDAFDPDSQKNFSYLLAPNFTSEYFALNSSTGEITTLISFDREENDLYNLSVIAVDHDSPQQSSTVETVFIQILDTNDNTPLFLQALFTGSTSENSSIGTSVLTVQATDNDIGTNSALTYTIPSPVYSNIFTVDPVSGVLSTSSILNYEVTQSYMFEVLVVDSGSPPRSSSAMVSIAVLDYNDEPPEFLQSSYAATTVENIAVGTNLLQVAATDSDVGPNQILRFFLLESPGSNRFGIDPETGVLYTARQLNREEFNSYNLTVVANNSFSPVLQQTTVPVFINVTDLNDQHPSFDIVQETSVPESSSYSGTVIFTLAAQDGDEGQNGTITYQLLQGNEDGYFNFSSDTGTVRLVRELDYEGQSIFFLSFNATDNGEKQLSNYTTLIVRVTDVNDNTPSFAASHYSMSIPFTALVQEEVLVVMATDADSGTNAALTYSIVSGNEQGLFKINPVTGSVAVNQSLSTHSGEAVNFTVAASDPTLSTTATVSIFIRPSGASPVFNVPVFQASINESSSASQELLDFYPETFPVGAASFEILAGNDDAVFALSDGRLTANGPVVDYESKRFYQLSVAARIGTSVAYTVVNVQVLDVNEHAPVFPVSSFYVPVSETAVRNQVFFSVLATDRDGSSPANTVRYSITSGNLGNRFSINPNTGQLRLNNRLDYNVDDHQYSLTITAANTLSVPPLSTSVVVQVELLDGNRHRPVFNPSGYSLSIVEDAFCENVTTGRVVQTVSATDEDMGSNGEILYGLLGDHHFVDFHIDRFSGNITVERCLDFERQTFYTLLAVASDRGSDSLSATAAFLVTIIDVNDNTPQWDRLDYTVTIPENITIGSIIINVTATDADETDIEMDGLGNRIFHNRNGYVTYSISSGDQMNQFAINPDTGDVSIATSLNREQTQEYNLVLNATDGGGRFNNSFLHITVEDINTFTPNFTSDVLSADIPEDALPGTFITRVVAMDNDLLQNSIISYSISEGGEEKFRINSTTGDVYLNASIDREERANYTLIVEAVDQGAIPLTGSAMLQISVLDVNEHPPVFSQDEYTGDVFENIPDGFIILQVTSSDQDFGENSTASYSIIDGNEDDLFAIDAVTGDISVAGELDFEEEEIYELVIGATDVGPVITRLSSEVNVTVSVLDRNDNRPELSQASYQLYVAENTPPSSPLLQLNASDDDSGVNQEIIFSLSFTIDPLAMGVFSVDGDTGLLSLTSPLDRETKDTYSFTVIVADGGTPSLNSSAIIMIFITDNNDNFPLFSTNLFTGSISENQPLYTSILGVSASDADIDSNAEIVYSISHVIQNQSDCVSQCSNTDLCSSVFTADQEISQSAFIIDSNNGSIVSGQEFDRETISQYVFVAEATDSSINETKLSSSVCVHVTILDENDNSPSFTSPLFTADVAENAAIGVLVIAVTATDLDVGMNSDITYMIEEGSAQFTIHPTNGEIRTMIVFDRETQDQYNVTVLAIDGGSTRLTGTALVMVAVLDENDEEPVFSQNLYEVDILETLPIGQSVLQLSASDNDTANNSFFVFSILTSQPPSDHFLINATTGVIYSSSSIDRENISSYLLTVQVEDQDVPSLSSTAQVNITILDTNDNSPVFLEEGYTVSIEENYLPSESFLDVLATDADIGTNSNVFYSIIAIAPAGADITIDTMTGSLSLVSELDAELSLIHNVTIRADNGPATPSQHQDTLVVLTVLDQNDNAPEFEFPTYKTIISEQTPIGGFVIQLSAEDSDATVNNSQLTFTLVSNVNESMFAINSTTGLITLSDMVDRETQAEHLLTVVVTDNGQPSLSDDVEVTVIVTDENDNPPIFQQSDYLYEIQENLPVGTSVGRVFATDSDVQNITYRIANETEDDMLFTVDAVTGEIFSAESFDREEETQYSITVLAVDDPGEVGLTADVIVNVTILDENDNIPQFDNETYEVYHPENLSVGATVLTVSASDLDEEENSTIVYSILPLLDSEFFQINKTTGVISLVKSFDREEQDLHQIIIRATDLGTPPLNSTVEVSVYITDNNDNVPVLNQTLYTASLLEDTPTGSYILTAAASDRDIDENADILFFLSDSFGGVFSIDAISGVLRLADTVDYELAQNYSFFIVASDDGDPQLMSSSQTLIYVLDINDNSPTFEQDLYQVSIPENSILGTSVFHVPATDRDSTSNSELRFTILSGNNGNNFALGEETGVISVAGYLDRETQPFVTVDVRVVDQGTPQFTASATVNITVSDTNDHAPQFVSKVMSVTIPENTPIGSEVFVLQATDEDLGENAQLTYGITSEDSLDYFDVNNQTGRITVEEALDYESSPLSFSIAVLVHDNGSPQLFDTATLLVHLSDTNDNPPSLTQSRYFLNISIATEVGTPIAHLLAVDPDSVGAGGQVMYSLGNGSTSEVAISATGTLRVATSSLTSGEQLVTVDINDGGTSVSLDVELVIPAASYGGPLFNPATFLFEVPENALPGHSVGVVMTSSMVDSLMFVDPQSSSSFATSVLGLFEIHANGSVNLIGQLDYETTPSYVLNVRGQVSSGEDIFTMVSVQVTDSNDNPPVFSSEEYSLTVSEETPFGSTILTIATYDPDSPGVNRETRLSIAEGTGSQYFALNPSTGVLTIVQPLDREAQEYIQLMIIAINHQATPMLSSTAKLTINVTDFNDNSPQFSEMFYRVSISENSVAGSEVIQVTATDPDEGSNAELVYSILHQSESGAFSINLRNGSIFTQTDLSQLDTDTITVSVMVSDRGAPVPNTDTAMVFITIHEDNRFSPEFTQPGGYTVSIPETLPVDSTVVELSAIDPDDNTTITTFSIAEGNVDSSFSISDTGLVTVSKELSFQAISFFTLTVTAEDDGFPPRTTSVPVNITIIDVNNHSPQFNATGYQATITENTPIGTPVIQVFATDIDAVTIEYAITQNFAVDGVNRYAINQTTGEIRTAAAIDREEGPVVELLVSAIDTGYPTQRSTSTPVTINILDSNDELPQFNQSHYTAEVVRLLPAGQYITMVMASDPDVLGDQLQYSIVSDTSGGLFQIDPVSAVITTAQVIPENAANYTNLTVSASDGKLNSSVLVTITIMDDGMFCEAGGFCTTVRAILLDCSYILPTPVCSSYCSPGYELTPLKRVCITHSCENTSLVPCIISRDCRVPNHICGDQCPDGMGVCPTTSLCFPLSHDQSCDPSLPDVCVSGQTLVQYVNETRRCVRSSLLPPLGQSCTSNGSIFCDELMTCSNLSAPHLCRLCPIGLLHCSSTNQCVAETKLCCNSNAYFCPVLDRCILNGLQCRLPNIAPVISTNLILLDSLMTYSSLSPGHMIGALLGNNDSLAVDSQGEELGVAITEASSVEQQMGEWQYALCDGPIILCRACSNLSSPWTTIDAGSISKSTALFLPNTACLRFWRKTIELEGAVWVRVKLWDGNQDGYISNSMTLVRYRAPFVNSTLPFMNTSSFSNHTTLLTTLVLPQVEPPQFSSLSPLSLSTILEDTALVDNLGGVIADVALSELVAKLPVHNTSSIPGLPTVPAHLPDDSYLDLIPTDVKTVYFQQVAEVNPTRLSRTETSNPPGVAVSLQGAVNGWQVSPSGDDRLFIFISDLLTAPDQVLLLHNASRLRLLPSENYHGNTSLTIRPWDGVAPSSPSSITRNDFTVTIATTTSFQPHSLGTAQQLAVQVEAVFDAPVITSPSAEMSPLPYLLQYHYQRLFTIQVAREPGLMRGRSRSELAGTLSTALEVIVEIQHLYAANSSHTYISFSVEGNSRNLTEIKQSIAENIGILSNLPTPGLPITSTSLDAHYGPGPGCQGSAITRGYPEGDQVSELVGNFARDNDDDLLGMAVVGTSGGDEGVWQYLRGNWSRTRQSLINTESGLWINFPPELQTTRALLLHGNDRVRYLPKPNYFWSTTNSPSITVKVWDTSIGSLSQHQSEVSRMNINTDPFIDTLQSQHRPVGRFSTATATVRATRHGCDGVVNSAMINDACCACGGNGAGCMGCDNTQASNKIFDACDMCGGSETTCLGCDFIPYSLTNTGGCGQCVSNVNTPTGSGLVNSNYPLGSFQDCNGVCLGLSLIDECEVCSGGTTSHQYNSDKDCTGRCSGPAMVDTCGYCTGPDTNLTFNQHLDCTGVCNGPFRADSCNVCQLPDQDGVVMNHTDCANQCFGEARLDQCDMCYGGTTGLLANHTVDLCGQCNGDNSTCTGCDGVLSSDPKRVDTCGNCGGNDCGCFKINSLSPARGPRSGGTMITIKGAGFFKNSTSSYNPSAPNCGVPTKNPDQTVVTAQCRLVAQLTGETVFGTIAFIVDHQTIMCTTGNTVNHDQESSQYSLSVRIDNGPFSPPISFTYDDHSPISISQLTPTQALIDSATTITFLGEQFINTTEISCLLEGFRDCVADTPPTGHLRYAAVFHNSSMVTCTLPPSATPCQFKVSLSLDGQASGIIQPVYTYTYAHRAPNVTSIHFSSDVTNLVISLDQQAELAGNASINCSAIFTESTLQLLGGSDAQCSWSSTAQREVHVTLPTSAMVQVNSPIRFKSGVVRTRYQRYSFEIPDMPILVSSERRPVAVLTGPTSIPSCGEVVFSAEESLHPGYRGFQYHWALYTNNASIPNFYSLVSMLKSLSPTSTTISLPNGLFLSSTRYHLQVSVTNSAGLTDRASLVLTKESSASLQIAIPGPVQYTLEPGQSLQLESDVITNDCASLNGALTIEWQLQRVVDTRRMILQNQQLPTGYPTSTSSLFLPSSSLATSSTYIVTLTVQNAQPQLTATRQITITVLNNSLVARVHGGNRTISADRTILLDARTSSIISSLSSPAVFVWQCSVGQSGTPCYNTTHSTPTAIALPQASVISLPASNLDVGSTYTFSLLLRQGTFSSRTSVLVEVTPSANSPITVEILTPSSVVIASEEVTIEALVWSQLPITAQWESINRIGHGFVNFSSSSVSQISYPARETGDLPAMSFLEQESIVTGRVSPVNLVLRPSVLTPDLQYLFRVTASQNGVSSYSETTIIARSLPQAASISIQPTTGAALSTQYTISIERPIGSASDHPLLYQFGVRQNDAIFWLTGPLRVKSVVALLPQGQGSNMFEVVARVIGRTGGHTDTITMVTVRPNAAATGSNFYQSRFATALSDLSFSRDWSKALSTLVSSLLNINSPLSNAVGTAATNLLSEIYHTYLPADLTHQRTIIPALQLLTSKLTIPDKQALVAITASIVNRLEESANANPGMTPTAVSLDNGVPSRLLSDRYGQARLQEHISITEVESLLGVWSSLVTSDTASAITAAMRKLSSALCKQMVLGERSVMATGGSLRIKAEKTTPRGAFRTTGGAIVDFGSALDSLSEEQSCLNANTACSDVCLYSYDFTSDYFSGDTLSLHADASRTIQSQIAWSDPSSVELFSSIVSLDFSIPVQDMLLSVQNLPSNTVSVNIPAIVDISMTNGSTPLCLHRDSTGTISRQWRLDSLQQPSRVTIEGTDYFICRFTHLTDFAVGLLPPPVIPPPSSTPPPPPPPSPTPSSSSVAVSVTPSLTPIAVPSNAGTIAGVVVVFLMIAIAVMVVVLVIGLVIWKKKRSKMMQVSPSFAEVEPVQGTKFENKPLTPDEAKTPIRVIQLLENGERTLLGTAKILPSMRLRELRNLLTEEFNDLKQKAYYLCTKELCDIDPASEQQQFVSIVYSGAVFLRHVKLDTPLVRHQFCVCGKAAQFECSSCNAQGYCSQECQRNHWNTSHQKLCSRLSEKKRRSEVLLRRQTSNNALTPIFEAPNSQQQDSEAPRQQPASPTDWKSFLTMSRGLQSPTLPKQVSTTSVRSLPRTTPAQEQQPKPPAAPQSLPPLKTPISPVSRPSLPPTRQPTALSIGKLASQTSLTQPARPLYPPASRVSVNYGARRQPSLTTPGGIAPSLSRPSVTSRFPPTPLYGSNLSYAPQQSIYSHRSNFGYTPQQQQFLFSPVQQQAPQMLFNPAVARPQQLPLTSMMQRPAMSRNISVRSIESNDLTMSGAGLAKNKIRAEPLLEESSEESSDEEATTAAPDRPPSLSLRPRHSRMESRKQKEEESSSEGSTDESDSDTN